MKENGIDDQTAQGIYAQIKAFADFGFAESHSISVALLVLRVAAIGNVRALIDLMVLAGYGCTFAFGRFIYRLYVFGHELDPTAPVKVKPFTPVIIGSKQIANFTTHSYPQLGAILVGVFLLGLVLILAWHLIAGRRAAAAAG
jgi:hypothetical protein